MFIQFTHRFILFTDDGSPHQYHIEQGDEKYQVSDFSHSGTNSVSFTFVPSCRLSGSATNVEKSFVKLTQSSLRTRPPKGCCQ